MANVIGSVASVLRAAGYRTGNANPGGVMPEITEPVLAVNLERLDAKDMFLVVRVTVVSPLKLGAGVCEEHGMKVCKLMSELGSECQMQPCKFNPKTEMFSVSVLATFYGHVLDEDWMAGLILQVRFGSGYYLDEVASVTAWQEAASDQLLGEAVWKIRIEERLSSIRKEDVPTNLGKIVVYYENGREEYLDCKLTGRKRIFKDGALQQIWEATATSRTLGT